MGKLVKVKGWRLSFFGKQERRFCVVCNNVGYTFKEFFSHKDTQPFKEHDETLHKMIKDEILWSIYRDCPT